LGFFDRLEARIPRPSVKSVKNMSFFSSDDARILNALIYQPSLKPGYEMVKNMLTWKDEWPVAISDDGMEKLFDL
jgi:hypothetical protein